MSPTATVYLSNNTAVSWCPQVTCYDLLAGFECLAPCILVLPFQVCRFGLLSFCMESLCLPRFNALYSQFKTSKASIMLLIQQRSAKPKFQRTIRRKIDKMSADFVTVCQSVSGLWSCSFGMDSLRKSKRPWISVSATLACSTSLSCRPHVECGMASYLEDLGHFGDPINEELTPKTQVIDKMPQWRPSEFFRACSRAYYGRQTASQAMPRCLNNVLFGDT